MADVRDALVPVTLYVAVDSGNFLEDVLWNPLDGRDAMASFALGFCRDVGLPTTQVPTLVSQIARQVGSWLEQAQRASRSAEAQSARAPPTTAAAAAAAKDVREIAYECWLGDSRYCDRVLWDVSDPHASPEDFAMATVKDLGLPDECALPIAVALRKQISALRAHSTKKGAVHLEVAAAIRSDAEVEVWGPVLQPIPFEEAAAARTRDNTTNREPAAQPAALGPRLPSNGPEAQMQDGPQHRSGRGDQPASNAGATNSGNGTAGGGSSNANNNVRSLRKRRGTRLAELLSSELAPDNAKNAERTSPDGDGSRSPSPSGEPAPSHSSAGGRGSIRTAMETDTRAASVTQTQRHSGAKHRATAATAPSAATREAHKEREKRPARERAVSTPPSPPAPLPQRASPPPQPSSPAAVAAGAGGEVTMWGAPAWEPVAAPIPTHTFEQRAEASFRSESPFELPDAPMPPPTAPSQPRTAGKANRYAGLFAGMFDT